jgi:hypothetical protein
MSALIARQEELAALMSAGKVDAASFTAMSREYSTVLERLLEGHLELLRLERLAEEIGRSELHGFDDLAGLTVAGEHDNRHVGRPLLEAPERLEAIHAVEHEIQGDEIGARHG